MLIQKLDSIKGALAYQRLDVTAGHGMIANRLKRAIVYLRLTEIVVAESMIALIQSQLSILCSHCCSYLTVYDDHGTDHGEWQHELTVLIKEIELPGPLVSLINERPSIKRTDLFLHQRDKTKMHLHGLFHPRVGDDPTVLEHYTGMKVFDAFPDCSGDELVDHFTELSKLNVADVDDLNTLVNLLGKDEAWSWRRAAGWTFLKGRLQ